MEHLDPDVIVERVLRFARARALFHPGPVIVAVSGGQDSLCMLDLLFRLRDELRIEPQVAHLDHMFRGHESAAEAKFVREAAESRDLPVDVATIDVPAYRARHHLAKQVAARYARYQFLARAAAHRQAGQVAIGHTADDAVETLLINLLRGSGSAGLGGMMSSRQMMAGQLGPALNTVDWRTPELPALRGDLPRAVRPILELSRAETEAYCLARSLAFRTDPSNKDTAYLRNWLRADLIPTLEQNAPGASHRLRSASELLSDDYVIVSHLVERLWSDLAEVREKQVDFQLAAWRDVDEPLQRHLLRKAVATIAGNLEGLGRVHVDAAQDVIRSGRVGARIAMPMGVYLEKGYNSFRIASHAVDQPSRAEMPERLVPLVVPGEVALQVGTIEARLVDRPSDASPEDYRVAGGNDAYLDADVIGSGLEARRRQPGDRFFPLGMGGPKKLQDFMVDEKVPRRERDSIPIVTAAGVIVWVAGHRIDDRFKVTADTRRILHLRFRG